MDKRVDWIDVTKGIAIILVILGHSFIGLKVNDLIFSFHMPLFFILSGYLFRRKEIKATIIKNAGKILVPYYITGVVVTVARAVSAYIQHWDWESIKNLTINTLIGLLFSFGVDESRWIFPVWSIGAIWFLTAFFWNTIFMQLLFRFTGNCQEFIRGIYVIAFGAVWYIAAQYVWIPTNVDVGGFAVIFTYFGYLLAKYDVLSQCKSIWFWILGGIILLYCWKTGGVNMVIRLYPNVMSILGALAGSMMVMKIGQYVTRNKAAVKYLGWYGRNSMKILCVHLFEIMIMAWELWGYNLTGIENNRLFVIICRIIWITGITFLLERVDKLRKEVYHKRIKK